jgi:hypothetical protein
LTSCSPCSEGHAESAVTPLELAYPVADSLVIETPPPPPPEQPPPAPQSPLELLQALLPDLISAVLLIALILYVGSAILEAVKEE